VTSYPNDSPQILNPIFFILFDQRIDPSAVLKTIQVKAGWRSAEIVLASQAEIDADERVSQLAKDAPEGRWLAFRATQAFQTETDISVNIGPKTPSAEGTLTTTEVQSFGFSTYAPLQIEDHGCYLSRGDCPPLSSFFIQFNNPLDMNVFSEDMLSVAPEIPGMTVNVFGNSIEINGETKGRTTYTVTVSGRIQDVFGQQLGRDESLKFKVGKSAPFLVNTGQNFLTLDPSATRAVFSIYAINYKKLDLKIYAVQPADWRAYKKYLRDRQQTDVPPEMPGKLIEDKSLALELPSDSLTQVDIDLSQYMDGSFGHFVVIVTPPAGLFESDNDKWTRFSQTIITWVQVTQIGLDAYTDHSQMVAWATNLKDGAPLAGVQIQPDNGSVTITSGADGVARFDIPAGASYLIARNGADQSILPRSTWSDDPWVAAPPDRHRT